MYGTYIAGATSNIGMSDRSSYQQVACVQVKCPGDVADGNDITPDVATHVDLSVVHKRATCKFK